MSWPVPLPVNESQPSLPSLTTYLRVSGWSEVDNDARTSMWINEGTAEDLRLVLPVSQDVLDYSDLVHDALRVMSYVERRSLSEIVGDMIFGAADTVAVRITPEAPTGQAPLPIAYSAISALRSYVIGSGAALDNHDLVLPANRPRRAETYAAGTRIATQPGSFILSLALPLLANFDKKADDRNGSISFLKVDESRSKAQVQEELLQVPLQPFGRLVTTRMATVARYAQHLAEEVSEGNQPIRVFGRANREAANATELEALSELGGSTNEAYHVRFAQSPLSSRTRQPTLLRITPGQQRIMREAAEYLRTGQPRTNVEVQGIIVRLSRDRISGPGDVVVQGVVDDSGKDRRFYVELTEEDYEEASRAHIAGLRVNVRGDLDIRGNYKRITPLRSFAVLPGLDYEE